MADEQKEPIPIQEEDKTVPSKDEQPKSDKSSGDEDNECEYEDDSESTEDWYYTLDPNYKGEPSQSQACYKRGIYYTPPGWIRKYRKRRRIYEADVDTLKAKKLSFPDEEGSTEDN